MQLLGNLFTGRPGPACIGVGSRRSVVAILLVWCVFGHAVSAQQSLAFSLFERYLEAFREQAGIPGISAAVVQNGIVVWQSGFGRRDVESNARATADTPYLIGELSQTIGSTLLLRKCVDQGRLQLTDPVIDWNPAFHEPGTTVRAVLSHVTPAGGFLFDPARYAALTPVVERCAGTPYVAVVAEEVFERFGMRNSVPGATLATTGGFGIAPEALTRYGAVVAELATPYRLDRGRPVRTEVAARSADASTGLISTVVDLARFDAALSDGALLAPDTLRAAWTPAMAGTTPLPMGLGWFVQRYNNEPLVWHFGIVRDGYSSLILKLPNRGITLIMLANSTGLSAPFALEKGDIVTTSLFARLFLRIFAI